MYCVINISKRTYILEKDNQDFNLAPNESMQTDDKSFIDRYGYVEGLKIVKLKEPKKD